MLRYLMLLLSVVMAVSACAGQPQIDSIGVQLKPGDVLDREWRGGDQAGERHLLFFGVPADVANAPFVDKSGKVTPNEKWRENRNTKTEVLFTRARNNIEKGKVYSWVFSGAFDVKGGKGAGPAPTWTVNTKLEDVILDRIVLSPKHGDITHRDSKTYTVTAYDKNNKDITAKCQFEWHTLQGSPSAGVDRQNLGGGLTKTVTWKLLQPNGTAAVPTPDSFFGALKDDGCAISVLGWGCGVNKSAAKTDVHVFRLKKGSLVSTKTTDENIKSANGGVKGLALKDTTVVKRTDHPTSVTGTLASALTVSGSVTVSGTAKGSVGILGTGVEVSVGVSGTTTVSVTSTVTKSFTVMSSSTKDVRVDLYGGQQETVLTWESFTVNTYSSGYVDYKRTGNGSGTRAVPYTEIQTTLQEPNPKP